VPDYTKYEQRKEFHLGLIIDCLETGFAVTLFAAPERYFWLRE